MELDQKKLRLQMPFTLQCFLSLLLPHFLELGNPIHRSYPLRTVLDEDFRLGLEFSESAPGAVLVLANTSSRFQRGFFSTHPPSCFIATANTNNEIES